MVEYITVQTHGQGLVDITPAIRKVLGKNPLNEGLCTLFIQHTSASLIVQENCDPTAKRDLEAWLNRLVPEHDSLYTHTLEGADDMPAHIKSVLTATSLSIPVLGGELTLGTWQGIYLWEHRHSGGKRKIALHIGS